MIFSTLEFLVFYGFCLVIYWMVLGVFHGEARRRLQHVVLLAASYYFYMSWNAYLIVLIIFTTLVDYTAARLIEHSESRAVRKAVLMTSVATSLALLGTFKYANFFLGTFNSVAGLAGTPAHYHINILLPVGISFYTFQSLSYIIDVYRGRIAAQRSLLDYAVFVAFFPQLVAGPITRAEYFFPQLQQPKLFADVNILRGVNYFLLGLVKKVLISDWISTIPDQLFADPSGHNAFGAWVGMIAYAIQIYCDFSGYSDMAVGSACLLGYNLPQNFRLPYLATSLPEVWRRWHISLSTWLRDYLYISLGGNQGGRLFVYRNLMITMLLGGLWHGANWRFVFWGGLHGLGLVVHREFRYWFPEKSGRSRLRTGATLVLCGIATFAFWTFTLAFFRAPSLTAAWTVARKLLFLDLAGTCEVPARFIVLFALMVAGHVLGPRYFARLDQGDWDPLPRWVYATGYALTIFALLLFAPDGTQPFIYFQF